MTPLYPHLTTPAGSLFDHITRVVKRDKEVVVTAETSHVKAASTKKKMVRGRRIAEAAMAK